MLEARQLLTKKLEIKNGAEVANAESCELRRRYTMLRTPLGTTESPIHDNAIYTGRIDSQLFCFRNFHALATILYLNIIFRDFTTILASQPRMTSQPFFLTWKLPQIPVILKSHRFATKSCKAIFHVLNFPCFATLST